MIVVSSYWSILVLMSCVSCLIGWFNIIISVLHCLSLILDWSQLILVIDNISSWGLMVSVLLCGPTLLLLDGVTWCLLDFCISDPLWDVSLLLRHRVCVCLISHVLLSWLLLILIFNVVIVVVGDWLLGCVEDLSIDNFLVLHVRVLVMHCVVESIPASTSGLWIVLRYWDEIVLLVNMLINFFSDLYFPAVGHV